MRGRPTSTRRDLEPTRGRRDLMSTEPAIAALGRGRVVLITGASAGIGAALSRELARHADKRTRWC